MPKAIEALLKASIADKREYEVTRERIQELLERYKKEELPAPYHTIVDVKLEAAVKELSGFLKDCESDLEQQISDLKTQLKEAQK